MDCMTRSINIPLPFQKGQVIDQIILISDVDGVIREGVDNQADPRVVAKIKTLLENPGVDITFISGTAIENNPATQESWRQVNAPLGEIFGHVFAHELSQERVSIYGELGGHRMRPDGCIEILEHYTPEISTELGKLLIHAFLSEVSLSGTPQQKALAHNLQAQNQEDIKHYVLQIREHIDPYFRIIQNRAIVESSTSNPPWDTKHSINWLKQEMQKPHYLVSSLQDHQKTIGVGVAKRGPENGFNFLLISKTDKGLAMRKHIEDKLKKYPRALIVTLGDTQVDFPMHQHAHLAFHVGRESVLRAHSLPNTILIPDSRGNDSSHIEGTLQVLQLLINGLNRSFFDLQYLPILTPAGQIVFHSINDLRKS